MRESSVLLLPFPISRWAGLLPVAKTSDLIVFARSFARWERERVSAFLPSYEIGDLVARDGGGREWNGKDFAETISNAQIADHLFFFTFT